MEQSDSRRGQLGAAKRASCSAGAFNVRQVRQGDAGSRELGKVTSILGLLLAPLQQIASRSRQVARPQISDPANKNIAAAPRRRLEAALALQDHASCQHPASPAAPMATQQDEGGVPFSMAHHLQQFRLLELPAELADLIDAPNPPPWVRHARL
jgi:hypothetical protein